MNKLEKFTPPPWTIGPRTDGSIGIHFVCKLDQHPGGIAEANAQLISASPDMYRALKLCEVMLTAWYKTGGDKSYQKILEQIQPAIQKAEGVE